LLAGEAVETGVAGVQDGAIPAGFAAGHTPFSLDLCEVWRFGPDGETDEGHNYSDGLGYLMQLGRLPMPASCLRGRA
jgi:hypothetical protein